MVSYNKLPFENSQLHMRYYLSGRRVDAEVAKGRRLREVLASVPDGHKIWFDEGALYPYSQAVREERRVSIQTRWDRRRLDRRTAQAGDRVPGRRL
jgi:hypothetical protein